MFKYMKLVTDEVDETATTLVDELGISSHLRYIQPAMITHLKISRSYALQSQGIQYRILSELTGDCTGSKKARLNEVLIFLV